MTENQPLFKSGYVAVAGRPNVGKSTLVNAFLAQKVAAVSPRPQTTRRRQLAILTLEDAQIVFIDTPGLHLPHHKLGEYLNAVATAALEEADLILWLVDGNGEPTPEDRIVGQKIGALKHQPPLLLALNKIDLLPQAEWESRQAAYQELLRLGGIPGVILAISARTGYQLPHLQREILDRLPPGGPFFDPDQVTDLYEREIAADLLREAALAHLREEVPHALAVRIDEYSERGEQAAYIAATLFVEKETQKGIVIGKGGEMLKQIGTTARQEIEAMSGRKVFLELRVKVNKNWRNNPEALRLLGFTLPRE